MFPTLTGLAAFAFALFGAAALATYEQYLLAVASAIGGLCAFALLKTLSDIADTLADIRERGKQ